MKLEEKKTVLNWMIKNNIRELNNFGRVMSLYYTNKEDLMAKVKKNQIKEILGRG